MLRVYEACYVGPIIVIIIPGERWPGGERRAATCEGMAIAANESTRHRWRRRLLCRDGGVVGAAFIVNAHMGRRESRQHQFHFPYGHVCRRRRHPLSAPEYDPIATVERALDDFFRHDEVCQFDDNFVFRLRKSV